jgi:DNA-directed RNA polymerase subunit F
MILNREPLSMTEISKYLNKDEETSQEVAGFVKKFVNLDLKDAEELKQKLNDLNLMKIKPEHIVKILDLMPETGEDLNKIFNDVGLDEDETKKILETVKEFK